MSATRRSFIAAGVISVLPAVIILLGVDVSNTSTSDGPGTHPTTAIDHYFAVLSGAFTHTILEWTSVVIAAFTALFALTHYQLTRKAATAALGVALFWAGTMDAFHTLAANRLIPATADNARLIPFTWALCRLFNGLILLTGLGVAIAWRDREMVGLRTIAILSALCGFVAGALIHYCANSADLPRTQFPDQLVTRPWDVAPLVLYLVGLFVAGPLLHRTDGGPFNGAVWASMVIHVAVQLHMVFGSSALFDGHFNAAHALKACAYALPAVGLLAEYSRTVDAHARARADVEALNQELEAFAYAVAHDLRAPARHVHGFATLLEREAGDQLDERSRQHLQTIDGAGRRMGQLVDDLLAYVNSGRDAPATEPVDLDQLVAGLVASMPGATRWRIEPIGRALGDEPLLRRAIHELLDNAVKFGRSEVAVTPAPAPEGRVAFVVRDDGPGFDPRHGERIFGVFERLGRGEDSEGTGIGLAHVRRIVERHGGRVWARGTPGEGAEFGVELQATRTKETSP